MKKLVVASRNKGKLNEIKQVLEGLPFEVVSMEEAGFTVDIEESGMTFEDNALIKAKAVYDGTGEMVMADDSGLEVDWLGGAPGVYTARFAGEGASDMENIRKLLELLKGVPETDRKARFVSVISVILPEGEVFSVRGECEGYITQEPKGHKGFGYDPIFYLKEFDKTMAEIDIALKNSLSHRGKALRLMVDELKKRF